MQDLRPDSSLNPSQERSAQLSPTSSERPESTSMYSDNVAQQHQYRRGAENGGNNGLGLGQGSWPSQLQHHHNQHHHNQEQQHHHHHQYQQPLVQQYNQMILGAQDYPLYHQQISPQYISYQAAPVQYGAQMMHQYPSISQPQSQYDGTYNNANLRRTIQQFPIHPQTAFQYSSAFSSMPISTTQQIRSPRQQLSDTLKRGVQSFDYKPSGISDEVSSLKSPSISQGPSSLPARPDSAIRANQVMESEGKGEIDGITKSGKVFEVSTTTNQPGPSRPAPTVPLFSRFPPLPPKPKDKSNLTEVRTCFEKREEALMFRIEALGFQPEAAWQLFNEEGEKVLESKKQDREAEAPILGIRLLQKLDQLQRENEELLELFTDKMAKKSSDDSVPDDKDVMKLLQALIKRAEIAEEKIVQLEQALAIACEQNSSAIVNKAGPIPSVAKTEPWKPVKINK